MENTRPTNTPSKKPLQSAMAAFCCNVQSQIPKPCGAPFFSDDWMSNPEVLRFMEFGQLRTQESKQLKNQLTSNELKALYHPLPSLAVKAIKQRGRDTKPPVMRCKCFNERLKNGGLGACACRIRKFDQGHRCCLKKQLGPTCVFAAVANSLPKGWVNDLGLIPCVYNVSECFGFYF